MEENNPLSYPGKVELKFDEEELHNPTFFSSTILFQIL
jgi:hypothetical protein